MKQRINLLLFGMFLIGITAAAQTKLVVNGPDGKATNIPVGTISEVTFSENGMTVVTPAESLTFAFSDISDISFDAQVEGVDGSIAELDDLTISYNSGLLSVTAPAEINLSVFNIQGQQLIQVSASEHATVDMNPLSSGIYVVRVNNKTIKLTR